MKSRFFISPRGGSVVVSVLSVLCVYPLVVCDVRFVAPAVATYLDKYIATHVAACCAADCW
jgi:hypothetical protein